MSLTQRAYQERQEEEQLAQMYENLETWGLAMTNHEVDLFMKETEKQEKWLEELIRDFEYNRFEHWQLEHIELMKFLLQFKPQLFSRSEENE